MSTNTLRQAFCARHGLAIGAATAWAVRCLMALTSPVSWPMARVLDWLLGKDRAVLFRRAELKVRVSGFS